jgi:hypothetical protein
MRKMKIYNVELTVTKLFVVEAVPAKNTEDAIARAWAIMEKNPESYYSDTETQADAEEL